MQMEERIVFLLCRRATSVCLLPLSCQTPPTVDNPVLRCADGDMCIFGTLTMQANCKCTRGCGGYLHGTFCGVQ